jgi:hypothetical protein
VGRPASWARRTKRKPESTIRDEPATRICIGVRERLACVGVALARHVLAEEHDVRLEQVAAADRQPHRTWPSTFILSQAQGLSASDEPAAALHTDPIRVLHIARVVRVVRGSPVRIRVVRGYRETGIQFDLGSTL